MQPDLAQDIAAAKRGESKALDALYERNLPPLIAFVRARAGGPLAGPESALDLAQAVFREVLQGVERVQLRGETAFRNWLFASAARKVRERVRQPPRDRRLARAAPPLEAETDADALLSCYAAICTPSRHAGARQELARIEAALLELPAAQRDAVVSSRLLGLTDAQIAEQMGCSEAAVRGLVARGLAALDSQLDDD